MTCQFRGAQIDCSSDEGTWSNDRQCWVSLADPQPPKDSSIWEGNTRGAIYECTPPAYSGGRLGASWGAPSFFWSDAAPPVTSVSPAALAREAVERMDLVAPTVGATPLPGGDEVSLVGLPTWLWIDGADAHSWGPITRTAAAGGVRVSATAQATRAVWSMGDGTTFTCTGPGTPWTPQRGTGPSPTCGHRYERPSDREPHGTFTIRATTHWRVDWTGAGQRGVITFALTGTRDLRVTELQVLQTG